MYCSYFCIYIILVYLLFLILYLHNFSVFTVINPVFTEFKCIYCLFLLLQGVPSDLRLGFFDLDFEGSTDSAWDDGNLVEVAG